MRDLSDFRAKVALRYRRDGFMPATRYYFSVLKEGLLYVVYDRRWDRLETKRTSEAVDVSEADIIGSTQGAEHRRYHAFPRLPLIWSIKALGIDPSKYSFVDYGSGKGRILLTAGRFPFKQVIGVEFSRSLHEQALENIAAYPRKELRCTDILSRHLNAVDFTPPPGNFVAFFFNPFPLEIVERVADHLERAAAHASGSCFVIFANTKRFPLFIERPVFHRVRPGLFTGLRLLAVSTVPVEIFLVGSSVDHAYDRR